MVLLFPEPIFVVVNDSGRIRLLERPPLFPLEIAFEFAQTLRQYGPKGIEHSELPIDICSRMSNPREFLPGRSLVATAELQPLSKLR